MQATLTLGVTIYSQPQVTTVQLPAGAVGMPYSLQCVAGGGLGPYTWSASGLPSGLTCNSSGLISGTPTASGTGNVTLTVNDSSGL